MWLTSVSGPANQSTEDAETLNLLWKPNLEIYGLQVVVMVMVMVMVTMVARYDVIAKMESFSEDTQFTLAQVWALHDTEIYK